MDQRFEQLKVWLKQSGVSFDDISVASADASFRRYFRITGNFSQFGDKQSLIVMDAPPEMEDSQPFITIGNMLFEIGINVPQILKQDLQKGYLLLTDLGDTVYLSELNNKSVDALYQAAMNTLILMQQKASTNLPVYNESLLLNEMRLFPDWYLDKHLKVTLSDIQKKVLENTFDFLIDNALKQPQVCVHRDYHSRNIMINKKNAENPGILDFQDAVYGPVTYDLVSLLKDCYINWPRQKIETWVKKYHAQAEAVGIIQKTSFEQFMRWFDLMGLQRHLKVAGIFTRLKKRDGKTGYMKDIPRTMDYVLDVVKRYPELKPFSDLLNEVL